ncbi:ParB/RepB/Spo0J family partition protein [Gilvimarinus agarilyticus]|uniref:ParB/RepB/Spo0J family partition protein n=1 Tax=Gilvimarinus sp. 2_MG-2023 TaxID=3062666 RepID=UPI001C0A09BC|nr:ParB/RepB/Spo0J family partition protein [Gilvimarinus sp. 2_MG-2023]MBU2887713.1 ParB/RepB/Spo0J family partition protein [Gilvimarinus agarilyticus]MDO6572360.1 ParB/RepB/Spo0J family partition protein [Gilvimarinus sp. 2_MG-2023]
MSKKSKYGDTDELLNAARSDQKPLPEAKARTRRPLPAVQAMSGERKGPARFTDELKEQIVSLKQQLSDAEAKGGAAVVLTMPVSGQKVEFYQQEVNPELVDVSAENERLQEFLDPISLGDILPSIEADGQQKPGTLRPKADGRFELIEGSRRLASVKLVKKPFLALVGEVPDVDVRALSVIENKHKDVSAYEKAQAYQRQLDAGEFKNWSQLGIAKGISTSHISRYKACVELDEIFVRILRSPSDMPLSYGETVQKLMRRDAGSVLIEAKSLLKERRSANDVESVLDAEEILKRLKSSVRGKQFKPTKKQPVRYESQSGKVAVKHSITSSGTTKLELIGVKDEQVEDLVSHIVKSLKVEKK